TWEPDGGQGRDGGRAGRGSAAGVGGGPAQTRHRPARGLGVGATGARPVGRHLREARNRPRRGLHSRWRGRTVRDLGRHRRGVGVGTIGVLRAYAKGAPVRVIGAGTTGTANYLDVQANSPIKTVKDINGKTIAYWTSNPSSRYDVFDLIKQFGLKARPTAIGGAAATFNQVMAGRVDVGWAEAPFGVEAIEQGKIRVVA